MSAAVVLPIELSKFDARCVQGNEGVEIAWRSDTEVNNDYYIIQRSTNAIDWEDVEIVPSSANISMPSLSIVSMTKYCLCPYPIHLQSHYLSHIIHGTTAL